MPDASGLGYRLYENVGFPILGRRAYLGANERLRVPTGYSDLTAEGLTLVLQALQRGEVDKWAELVQYALKDDLFVHLYATRVTRVAQADYQIIPNEFGDPGLAAAAAQFVHEMIARIENWDEFIRNMLHAIALGFSAHEIEWDRDGTAGVTFPRRIHYINPNRFRYDEQWKLRLYDHGTKTQKAKSQYGEPLWPGSWVVHHHYEVAGDPCDAGIMRYCIWRWLFRRWADTFWITALEKYGSPWTHAIVAPSTPDEVRQRIKDNLIDLNIERAAVIETGGQIVVTPPAMGTGSASQHELYMDFAKESLTSTWLGASDAASPGENGSQAAVSGRISATMDPRMVTDGSNLCGTLHSQLFKWMLVYNMHRFGGQMPPIPKMQFKTASDEAKTDGQDLAAQTAADAGGFGNTPPAPYEVRGDVGSPSLDGTLAPAPMTDQFGNPLPMDAMTPPMQTPLVEPTMAPPPEPPKPVKKANIDSLIKVVAAVCSGQIPRSSAVGIIAHTEGIDPIAADAILADAMGPAPVAQAPQPFDPNAPQPNPLVDPQQIMPGDPIAQLQSASNEPDPYHPPPFQPEGAPPPLAAPPTQPAPDNDDLDLGRLLSEADALLGEVSLRRPFFLKFNPSQPRDENGRWTSSGNAIGYKKAISADQRAKLEAELEPARKEALAKLKAKIAAKAAAKTKGKTKAAPTPAPTPAPAEKPKAAPAEKPKAAPAEEPKVAAPAAAPKAPAPKKTKEKSAPPTLTPSTGATPIEGGDSGRRARLEEIVGGLDKKAIGYGGGVATAAVQKDLGPEAAYEATRWANDWVADSSEERATRVLDALKNPDSWASSYYAATQAHLKNELANLQKLGIADKDGYITMYRGVSGAQGEAMRKAKKGDPVNLGVRGISSWSTDHKVAGRFAKETEPKGSVLTQKVHYSRVFAAHSATNKNGNWSRESEYVLLAPEGKVAATVYGHAR